MLRYSVRVPGSSANLGAGFDSLAVALDCWLRVDVAMRSDSRIIDAGSPDLLGGANLVIDAMYAAAGRFGLQLPGADVLVESDIPVARGLGSSAAALVAGIVAAGELAGCPLTPAQVIDAAGEIEGHADNVSASVLGGVTVSLRAAEGWVADVIAAEIPWTAVVFVPEVHAFTSEARALLPPAYTLPDVVANVGRAALLAHAMHVQRGDLLREAMADRLHQPYRATIFRHLQPCIAAALDAGAVGAALSGAGPAILAFSPADCAGVVGAAMQHTAARLSVTGESWCMRVPAHGMCVRQLA
ncbi:MAG: homoserine kinase [Chloroflexi bacterium]|nr:MAG: homoserine kinase [Chloroflexota bacterium]